MIQLVIPKAFHIKGDGQWSGENVTEISSQVKSAIVYSKNNMENSFWMSEDCLECYN
jgi:hypothetical protein